MVGDIQLTNKWRGEQEDVEGGGDAVAAATVLWEGGDSGESLDVAVCSSYEAVSGATAVGRREVVPTTSLSLLGCDFHWFA